MISGARGLVALVALLASACTGVTARKALPLSMGYAFPAVRQDVEAGVAAQNPPMSAAAVAGIEQDLNAIASALESGDRAALLTIDWPGTLRPLAEAGVMARAQAGEIVLGLAQSRLERVRLFSESWTAAVSR